MSTTSSSSPGPSSTCSAPLPPSCPGLPALTPGTQVYLSCRPWDGAAGAGRTVMELPAEQPPSRAGRAQVATLLADPVWDLQPAARTADNPVGRWVTSGCQALTPPNVHPPSQCSLRAYCVPDLQDPVVGPVDPAQPAPGTVKRWEQTSGQNSGRFRRVTTEGREGACMGTTPGGAVPRAHPPTAGE